MVKEPTFDSFASPSPSVAVSVAFNATQVSRSIPANKNRENQTTCNIQDIYLFYSNQID